MECPICLEAIGPASILGRIHGCLHVYHRECVVHWSTQSNSCPTCRKSFHGIDIIAKETPDRVIETIAIKDRLLGTDAIDHIPAEYIIPAQTYATLQQHQQDPPDDADAVQTGVCVICSSAQYSMRRNSMVSCISCGGKFHTACLGHSGEASWFCPVCDCHQEFPVAVSRPRAPRVSRVSLSSIEPTSTPRRASPGSRRTPACARNGRLLLSETPASSSAAIIVDSDHWDAGPSQPRYMDEPRARKTVWNGGVLLRRQARELQNLTPEERSSWNLLESARSGNLTDVSDTVEQDPSTRRRRRKRPVAGAEGGLNHDVANSSVAADPNTVFAASSSSEIASNGSHPLGANANQDSPARTGPSVSPARVGPSRIASLMSQIKSRSGGVSGNQVPSSPKAHFSSQTSHNNSTGSLVNGSESNTHSPSSPVDVSETEAHGKTTPGSPNNTPNTWTPRPLTLDEKSMVQTHVRNNLRPLYRSSHSHPPQIHSEDEYIRINKGISRQVYSHISSLCTSKGPGVYGEFFQGESDHLKKLVDFYVEGWTRHVG
ncbi:hypothetical protein JCM33374_g294 [Metschnikowia sp. JCM 33374]|nr:hypothetical protein JCM33374_g294 [Metschnikowia sp. JCM 33374]